MPVGRQPHGPGVRLRGSSNRAGGCGLPWRGAPAVEVAAPGAFVARGEQPRTGEGERQANDAVESDTQVE